MSLYLGEASGARILLYGVGIQQVGDDYEAELTSWDLIPAQEMGDCVFRSLGLSFSYTNGYALGITPIVDGIALAESTFSGGGSGTNGQAQVFIGTRGTRIAATIRTISRAGTITFSNLQASLSPIRSWP